MTDIPLVPHPIKHSNIDVVKRLVADSGLKFQRPWLSAGGLKFTWPVGTEGFRVTGTALTALHRYIGDNVAVADVIHFNEGHIEMSGTLPGLTSPANMVKLTDVLMMRNKKILSLPGILPKLQYVVVENYDFTHTADDRLSLIDYSISFIRVGTVGGSTSGKPSAASSGTTASRSSKSKSPRVFTTTQSIDTFRAVADKVYGDVNQWPKLVDLNKAKLITNNPKLKGVNSHQLPYYRWPVGTKIEY
jgi:hypothetical protein